MKVAKAWEEPGVDVPAPHRRQIKVLFAPDKEGVDEVLFSLAILPPEGRTDYHRHDRPELIYVISGHGMCLCDGQETHIQEDVALWVLPGEQHQIINEGEAPLKLATFFIPPYTASNHYRRCLGGAEARPVKG